MKNQEIKAGDYVYIPSESTKPIQCFYDEDKDCLRINFEENNAWVWFDKNGCLIGKLDKTNIPLLWLATPENKAKIEEFYGCQLEDIPVDEHLQNFCKELDLLLKAQKDLSSMLPHTDYSSPDSSQTKRNTLANQIKNHRENLIEMFKEKGNLS